jgi:hypothetical protein
LDGKTWREAAETLTWVEFREAILERDPLQTVNLPDWRAFYERLRGDGETR